MQNLVRIDFWFWGLPQAVPHTMASEVDSDQTLHVYIVKHHPHRPLGPAKVKKVVA